MVEGGHTDMVFAGRQMSAESLSRSSICATVGDETQ